MTAREALEAIQQLLAESAGVESVDLIESGPGQAADELGVVMVDGTMVIVSVELA